MAALHLVTGYSGTPHITAADQGLFNAGLAGTGEYVLNLGKKFEAQIINNNAVRIYDGCAIMNGRHVTLDAGSYLDAIIGNGTSGMHRHDIISLRYEKNSTTGVESVSLVVTQGTNSATTAEDPTLNYTASIISGAIVHDMPLYRVILESYTVVRVEPMFQMLAPIAEFQYGQNLLINGDFQCNQRGQKTYNATKVMYTLDMWRAYNVSIKARNDGIQLTGLSTTEQGYLTQFIQLGLLKTTTYTVSAMVDGELCTFTVTPGGTAKEKEFEKFKISVLTLSTWDNDLPEFNYYDNKLKVNICPIGTNSIIVNYVDVFEGAVAYPHVKEDPASAMARCRRYLQTGTYFSPYLWYKSEDTYTLYDCVLPYEPMVKKPNILNCNAHFYTKNSKSMYVSVTSAMDKTRTDVTYIRSAFELEIEIDSTDALHERCGGFKLVYILSCEFKPNGD